LNPNKANYATSGTAFDNGTSSGPRDIRFWIGHASTTTSSTNNDPSGQSFGSGVTMEWPQFPSRFRAYIATNSTVQVNGNSSSSSPFNTNILVYNSGDSRG